MGLLRFASAVAFAAACFATFSAPAGAVVPTTWCGNGTPPVNTNRKPELFAGANVHVLYAHASDTTDRFSTFANAIATDVATSDAWWRREDPTRTIRFDTFGFANCSGLGALDLSSVTLPRQSGSYTNPTVAFDLISDEIAQAPSSFVNNYVTYLVYYDGPSSQSGVCGIGGISDGQRIAIMFANNCGLTVGNGKGAAHTAAHELGHALGVLGPFPNECSAPNDGHVCDSARDFMYPFTDDSPLDDWFLDVNRNDYYGVTGAQFDLRNSPFLRHLDVAQQQLTLNVVGTGSADVESDVPGVSCSSTCTVSWDGGSAFQLAEAAGTKTRFVGWSGGCTGNATTCDVTMDAAKTITATFALQVPLTVQISAETGSGRVSSVPDNLLCPTACTADFDQNSKVTLDAIPGRGSRLEEWGGACSGRGACVVTMDQAKTVTATFGRATRLLRAAVTGKGRVVSSPSGIACPGKCVGAFGVDSTVRLTATASAGYRFARWTGACAGRGACTVAMTADAAVRAVFVER